MLAVLQFSGTFPILQNLSKRTESNSAEKKRYPNFFFLHSPEFYSSLLSSSKAELPCFTGITETKQFDSTHWGGEKNKKDAEKNFFIDLSLLYRERQIENTPIIASLFPLYVLANESV